MTGRKRFDMKEEEENLKKVFIDVRLILSFSKKDILFPQFLAKYQFQILKIRLLFQKPCDSPEIKVSAIGVRNTSIIIAKLSSSW